MRRTLHRARWIAAALIAVLLIASGTWLILRDEGSRKVTAYFTAAVGLYPGSDVRVLGVAIGTVDSVTPQGDQVRVEMSVRHKFQVPATAKALVVTPSLVSDRYVQLTPVYTGGAELPNGAVIPAANTAVPVELDQLFSSLDRLNTAIGPDGANAAGALSELIKTGASTLDGNGAKLGEMIRQLGGAARTLSGSQQDLFSTVDNLQKFTTMLKNSDSYVDKFNGLLAQVSKYFADERADFGAAMNELAGGLASVQQFVKDNRAKLQSNVDKLAGVTGLLAQQRVSLAEAVDTAPLALRNVLNAYDPATGTIDGRGNLNEFVLPRAGG